VIVSDDGVRAGAAGGSADDDDVDNNPKQRQRTLGTLFRAIENTRSLRNFPAKNEAVIECNLHEASTTVRVDAAFVVVPKSAIECHSRAKEHQVRLHMLTDLIKLSVVAWPRSI
jgi:hypothetical protein